MKFNNKKGFTLIELLAVIVILAIIMVIATIQVNKIIKNSRYKANEINKRQIKKAVRTCLIDKNNKVECNSVGRLIDNGYLDDFSDPFDKDNDNIDSSYFIDIKDEDNIAVEYNSNEYSCSNFTKKDKYDVGDIISLCNKDTKKSEDFYVIKDNGSTVTALSKYNLMVKYSFSIEKDLNTLEKEKDYGMQSAKALGVINERYGYPDDAPYTFYGISAFSYKKYWKDYPGSYPKDVFDKNSAIYDDVQNYKNYLNKISHIENINLLSYEQALSLGCIKGDCNNAPSWVVRTSYWLRTAASDNEIYAIWALGSLYERNPDGGIMTGATIWLDESDFGVRPVIEIKKSNL